MSFDKQDAALQEEILPNAVRRRVAVEMGASQNWYKYVGLDGAVLGIDLQDLCPSTKKYWQNMALQ